MEQEYSIPSMTDSMEVSPSKMVTPTSDTITSVYSIIMDDGEGGGGTLELSDNQIRTDGEVELNSTDEREEASESPIANQTATGAIVTVSAMPSPLAHTASPHLPRRIPGMVAKISQSATAVSELKIVALACCYELLVTLSSFCVYSRPLLSMYMNINTHTPTHTHTPTYLTLPHTHTLMYTVMSYW